MSTLTSNAAAANEWERDVEPTPEELAQRRYDNWLETESGIEFVDDQVVEKFMSVDGEETAGNIVAILKPAGRRSDGWRVFTSGLGYKVYAADPKKFRKPDVSAIRRERLEGKGLDFSGFMTIPADLAIEVISPGESTDDSIEKAEEYLANGFAMVWLVLTKIRKVYVFTAGSLAVQRLGAGDDVDGGEALPGFRCKVGDLFDN